MIVSGPLSFVLHSFKVHSEFYRPGRGGGRAGGGARLEGGPCGGGGRGAVGELEGGGVGGNTGGAGMCRLVGGRARLGGGVYGGGVMGGEGVEELGGGVGGSSGKVEKEYDGDDEGLLGVGGRLPCGAGGGL